MKNKLIESLRLKLQSEVLKSELVIQSIIAGDNSSPDDFEIVEYNLKVLSDARLQLKLVESMTADDRKRLRKTKVDKPGKNKDKPPFPMEGKDLSMTPPDLEISGGGLGPDSIVENSMAPKITEPSRAASIDPAARQRLLKINKAIKKEEDAMSLRDMMAPEPPRPTGRKKK